MSCLQPKVADPKTVSEYSKTNFEVDSENIHELDQIEFHRHTSEMLYSKIVDKTRSVTQLQNTIFNMQDHMRLDKASLQKKELRIKSLEDLVLQIGVDPSNIQVAQALIKQKNDDITALRKQLKLSQNKHPQEK